MLIAVIGGRDCWLESSEVVSRRGIAERVPLVRGVRIDPTGALWVQRYQPGVEAGPIDVFDTRGVYRRTLPGLELAGP